MPTKFVRDAEVLARVEKEFSDDMPFVLDWSQFTTAERRILVPAMNGIMPILWGEPGSGKTEAVRTIARRLDIPCVVLTANAMDPTDIMGFPQAVMDPDTGLSFTDYTTPRQFYDIIKAGRGIILIDEITSIKQATLAPLLTVIQDRVLPNGTVLPEGVWLVGAANEANEAVNGFDLPAPMANRLLHIKWDPTVQEWVDGYLDNWGFPEEVSDTEWEWRHKIVAFVGGMNGHAELHKMPESETERGKAWPSRRTWAAVGKVFAKLDDDLGSTLMDSEMESFRQRFACGLVGDAQGTEFMMFLQSVSLPSREEIAEDPSIIDWATIEPSHAHMALLSLLKHAAEGKDQSSKVVDAFIYVAQFVGVRDIAAGMVTRLIPIASMTTPQIMSITEAYRDYLDSVGAH